MKTVLALLAATLCAGCPDAITCPPSAPMDGGACPSNSSTPVYTCEWGGDSHGFCTTAGSCEQSTNMGGFAWTVESPASDCETPPSGCPVSFGAMANGSPCDFGTALCEFSEGVCGCIQCSGSGEFQWYCRPYLDVAPGCPVPRQKLGSSCSKEGLLCNYDSDCCGFISLGPDMECVGGTWIPQSASENQNIDPIGGGQCSCTNESICQ